MAVLSVGGLATGIDTNSLIDQLVALERSRGVGLLERQRLETQAKDIAVQGFNSRLLTFLGAVDALRKASTLLARTATSSDQTVLTASAASGASTGSTSITVSTLARASIATSANGVASGETSIASGSGSFAFRVGSGAVQTVSIDASTSLDDLVTAINELGAGATATAVNIGTAASPDFRLQLVSDDTGTSNELTIVTDDTTIGVAVTQSATNASFTLSGFATSITRESNTFDDVISGVTINLLATGGPVTLTVQTDAAAVAAKLEQAVQAFNDIVTFVESESQVVQDTDSDDRSVSLGPLALDSTVRTVLDSLHSLLSSPVDGLTGDFTLLAQVGVTTQSDGTLKFDADVFKSALASNEGDVTELLAGLGTVGGVGDLVHAFLEDVTNPGGLVDNRTGAIADELRSLEERIAAGERNLDAFEDNLRATFASLEVLVSSLQAQGQFLDSVFRRESS